METTKIDDNSGIIIQGFMRNRLGLAGTELLIYALIFTASKADEPDCYATQEYAAEWTGASERGIRNALKSLLNKGLIEQSNKSVGGKWVKAYRTTDLNNTERKNLPNGKNCRTEKFAERQKLPNKEKYQKKVSLITISNDSISYDDSRNKSIAYKNDSIALTNNSKDIVSANDIVKRDIDISKSKDKIKKEIKKFIPPTVEEVEAYCKERDNGVDAENFVDFYSAKDWFIGKNKMKDWKAAVRTWEKRDGNKKKPVDRITELDDIF